MRISNFPNSEEGHYVETLARIGVSLYDLTTITTLFTTLYNINYFTRELKKMKYVEIIRAKGTPRGLVPYRLGFGSFLPFLSKPKLFCVTAVGMSHTIKKRTAANFIALKGSFLPGSGLEMINTRNL